MVEIAGQLGIFQSSRIRVLGQKTYFGAQVLIPNLKSPNGIILYCDRARLLPETDPYHRQITMSHGTFLEFVDIVVRERGMLTNIELFPQGEFGPEEIDLRPMARILICLPAVPHLKWFQRLGSGLRVKRRPMKKRSAGG
jgi:hypothetical protein